MKKIALTFVVGLMGGFCALGMGSSMPSGKAIYSAQTTSPESEENAYGGVPPVDFVPAANKSIHSVVHIKTELQERTLLYDSFFGFFNNQPRTLTAFGSGVIISKDGYIVTNNHVVQGAENIQVTLNNKQIFTGKLIGTDPATDLALIKIDADNLQTLSYGNSDSVQIGEWVLAVGNPYNLTSTVTAGIVSAKARNINILGQNSDDQPIESFIQTDAAVNSGNSGGALVNTRGELIGINAAIASNTGSYTGYSFAIPVNIVRKVVDDLTKYGVVQRGYLGVNIANNENTPNNAIKKGVYVASVVTESGAGKAGIVKGDIILAINGKEVQSSSELTETVGLYSPGDKVNVTVERDGKSKDFSVTLLNHNGKPELITKEDERSQEIIGADFENVNSDALRKMNLNNGVMVKDVKKSALRNVGIRNGFVITTVDSEIIRSVQQLKNTLSNKRGRTMIEGIYPGDWRNFYYIIVL